jgi:hypothetical protein
MFKPGKGAAIYERQRRWLEAGHDLPGAYRKQCENRLCGSWFYAAHRDARFCTWRCWRNYKAPRECAYTHCDEIFSPTRKSHRFCCRSHARREAHRRQQY